MKYGTRPANAILISTQYGDLFVWEPNYPWAYEVKGESIHYDFPLEEGGLILPSGKTYFTSPQYKWAGWDHSSGFLRNIASNRQDSQISRKEEKKIIRPKFYDPEILLISDLFYDLFLGGMLPNMSPTDFTYHLGRKAAVKEYCEKFAAIEEAELALNKWSDVENKIVNDHNLATQNKVNRFDNNTYFPRISNKTNGSQGK
jgi:hypothetical protein